jgi:hypothetical protein
MAEGTQEHSDHAWLSGTIPGDVSFLTSLSASSSREMGQTHGVALTAHARQAEMHSSDLFPLALLPHEDVVFVPHVSLQAILVLDSPDVDLGLWNATVAEMEASGKFLLLLERWRSATQPPLLYR